jgi:hypothetical protein
LPFFRKYFIIISNPLITLFGDAIGTLFAVLLKVMDKEIMYSRHYSLCTNRFGGIP